jgi:hypothetical protein
MNSASEEQRRGGSYLHLPMRPSIQSHTGQTAWALCQAIVNCLTIEKELKFNCFAVIIITNENKK